VDIPPLSEGCQGDAAEEANPDLELSELPAENPKALPSRLISSEHDMPEIPGANPTDEAASSATSGSSPPRGTLTISISNLSSDVTASELFYTFEQIGRVTLVRLVPMVQEPGGNGNGDYNGEGRGKLGSTSATLEFETEEQAYAAVQAFHETEHRGFRLSVCLRERSPSPSTGELPITRNDCASESSFVDLRLAESREGRYPRPRPQSWRLRWRHCSRSRARHSRWGGEVLPVGPWRCRARLWPTLNKWRRFSQLRERSGQKVG